MTEILLWHPTSFASDVNAAAAGAPLFYKCPEDFRVEVIIRFKEKDKILSALEKDPLLQQKLVDAFNKNKNYKQLVKFLGTGLKGINALVDQGEGDMDKGQEAFDNWFSEASLKKDVDPILQLLADDAGAVWQDYCKTKSDYTKYKVKIVAQFALVGTGMAVTVAVNAALLASSSFHFGAGNAIAIVGLAKSTVQLVALVIDCLKGVDTAIKDALETLYAVQDDFKKKYKIGDAKQLSKEVADKIFEAVIGTDIGLKTLTNAKKKLELARNKLDGTEVALHSLSQKIQKTIKKIDKMQASIKEQEKTPLGEREDKGKLGYDLIKIGKLEAKLNDQLKRMDIAQDMYAQRKKLIDFMIPAVEQLAKEHKVQQGAVKVLSGMLTMLELASKLATTDFTAIADVVGVSADAALLVTDKALIPAVSALADKVAAREKKKVMEAVVK